MPTVTKPLRQSPLAGIFALLVVLPALSCVGQVGDPLTASIEAARRTRDATQLESIKTQLVDRIEKSANDFASLYQLALVESYLADAAEIRKDKRTAVSAVDKAIDVSLHALQINDNSADAHSLLADLYGRKISLGTPMFAGPRYGPKVDEQNKRAMALDGNNPHAWASLGRQYLMTPKTFGGDVAKAIHSFEQSLALDASQDEAWVWLAKAFEKQGNKGKAMDALHQALELNPQSPFAQEVSKALKH